MIFAKRITYLNLHSVKVISGAIFAVWDRVNIQIIDDYLEKLDSFDIHSTILVSNGIRYAHSRFIFAHIIRNQNVSSPELESANITIKKALVNAFLKEAHALRKTHAIHMYQIVGPIGAMAGITAEKESFTLDSINNLNRLKLKHKQAIEIIEQAMQYYFLFPHLYTAKA